MRGSDDKQAALFSYLTLDERIPVEHPLRGIRTLTDHLLTQLSPVFAALYSSIGRPSIPPERLLRALLLQTLYTIRSERQLMEQLQYNLLYRWFVGLEMDEPVWDVTVYTKNRTRLIEGEVAQQFLAATVAAAQGAGLMSTEHFTVDGTLLEASASLKSFRPNEEQTPPPPDDPSNPTVNFHGERRSNATHTSTTDPDARLAKKGAGKEAKLCYSGHVLMENREGLVVGAVVWPATGTAEREAAVELVEAVPGPHRITVGGDKGYDSAAFVTAMRALNATPHVAQNTTRRRSAIDGRTTRHAGYAISQQKRKRIEEIFGWTKVIGLLRKLRHRGADVVDWLFAFTAAVYNVVRMNKLLASP
jgi:transposase